MVTAFIFRRLLQSIAVLLIVGLVAFAMFSSLGDPVASIVGLEVPQEDRDQLRASLGLNDSFFIQYLNFLGRALVGNFGVSYQSARPVLEVIGERLPATVELAVVSALLANAIAIPLGVYTAIREQGWLSRLVMTGSLIGVSIPTFVIGIFLIFIFSVTLGWLPSHGRGEVVALGGWTTGLLTGSGLKSLILPTLSLALLQVTLVMRLVRSAMLEVLRNDFIKFAWARGLPGRRVYFRHALRNSLIPVVTVIGLQMGILLAFTIVTETVFQWPGMGFLFIGALETVDVPVMTAFLLLVVSFFVVINLVVDLLYFWIDPRTRTENAGPSVTTGF